MSQGNAVILNLGVFNVIRSQNTKRTHFRHYVNGTCDIDSNFDKKNIYIVE